MSDPVSITIAVIDKTILAYQVFDKIKNLPKAFQAVQESLPVARNLLLKVHVRASDGQLQEDDQDGFKTLGEACLKRAEELGALCQKFKDRVGKADSNKIWDKCRMSYAALVSHGTRVEELMTALLKDIDLLWKDKITEKLIHPEIQHEEQGTIPEVIKNIESAQESVSDRDIVFAQNINIVHNVAAGGTSNLVVNAVAGDHHTNIEQNHNNGFQGNNVGTINFDQSHHYHVLPNRPQLQPTGPHFLVPFRKNTHFVGREDILDRLKEALFETESVESMAIYGLGGVGKTQVAMQMAHYAKEQGDWSVCWLSALSMNSFEQSCAKMIGDVGIPKGEEQDAKVVVQSYLESSASGKWFLIVDNADDISTIMGNKVENGSGEIIENGIMHYLPKNGDNCIMFTTRTEEVADAVADDIEKLDHMDEDEAKALFGKLHPRAPTNDPSADDLLYALTYLPLAISQAAAYMKKTRTSASDYLALLSRNETARDVLSREFLDRTRYTESQHAVAKTWLISFKQIQETDTTAADLLAFLSQIEPRAIPRSMLPQGDSVVDFQNAIGTLLGYTFLSQRDNGDTFDMHSLVHISLCGWAQDANNYSEIKRKAFDHLVSKFDSDAWQDRRIWQSYLPHVLLVLEVASMPGRWRDHDGSLKFWASLYSNREGRISEAPEVRQMVADMDLDLQGDALDRFISRSVLAHAYKCDGRIQEALHLLKLMIEVDLKDARPDANGVLVTQQALSESLIDNGQTAQAVQLMMKVVKIRETLPEDNIRRIVSQSRLAHSYFENSQYQEAVLVLERIAKHADRLAQDGNQRLGQQIQLHLGSAYRASGQVGKAIPLLEDLYQMRVALPETHTDLLSTQTELAMAYLANGQAEKALRMQKEVVKAKGSLREDHNSRLAAEQTLALAYIRNGQVSEGITILKRMLVVTEAWPKDHQHRLLTQYFLAEAYWRLGLNEKAIELMSYVSFALSQHHAPDHPMRVKAESWLASALREARQEDEISD